MQPVIINAAGALNKKSYEVFVNALEARVEELKADNPDFAVQVNLATDYPGPEGPTEERPLRGAALRDESGEKRKKLTEQVVSDLQGMEQEGDVINVLPCASMLNFQNGIELKAGSGGLKGDFLNLEDALKEAYPGDEKIVVVCMPPAKKGQVFDKLFGEDRVVHPNMENVDFKPLDELAKVLQRAEVFNEKVTLGLDGEVAKTEEFAGSEEKEKFIDDVRSGIIAISGIIVRAYATRDDLPNEVLLARADTPHAASELNKDKDKTKAVPDGMNVSGYLDVFGRYAADKALEKFKARGVVSDEPGDREL